MLDGDGKFISTVPNRHVTIEHPFPFTNIPMIF
jgi:hypothetical protein